jgi:hypothetical protein
MKIAYCLHGRVGGITGKNGEQPNSSAVVFEECSEQLLSALSSFDIDFFIHSWDVNLHDTFNSKLNPKKIRTETQIIFDIPTHLPNNLRVQSHYSRWYSAKQCLDYKSQFEREHNFKYDLVILTRFDLYWLRNFDFNKLDLNAIHFDWCTVNGRMYGGINSNEYGDRIICADSNNIDLFKSLYEQLSTYTLPGQCKQHAAISSHFCIPWHLQQLNVKNLSQFSLHYYGGPGNNDKRIESDFTIYRHI